MKNRLFGFAFFLCIICGIVGCKQKSMESNLTNNGIKFWDVFDYKKGFITGSYSFNKNGDCFYYSYKKGKRARIFDDDLVYPHTWNLKGDSILNIQGFDKSIINFNSNKITLLNVLSGDTLTLLKADKN